MTCACHPHPASASFVSRYRCSDVPKGQPQSGRAQRLKIQRDMIRMRRHLMIEGQRGYAITLKAYFRKMLNRVCDRVEHRSYHASASIGMVKTSVDLGFGANEAIWKQAIEDVLGVQANVELMADSLPTMQSVIAKSSSRVNIFLGEEDDHDASVHILRRAQGMARLVTRINETTRNNLANSISTMQSEGNTLVEIVRAVREKIPNIEAARIPTIVRTEVGRAIDEGTILALQGSSSVTHVMIVGCQAIEPGIPEIDGIPTCGIAGLPVGRLGELRTHVNHTGCILPQFFISDKYSGPIYSGTVEKKKQTGRRAD